MRRGIWRILAPIDRSLDAITSYRLVLLVLVFILSWGAGLALFDLVPFTTIEILSSGAILIAACWTSSYLFAKWLNIPRNRESDFITAIILILILSPATEPRDYAVLAAAGFLAMASKYLVVIGRRHIFNPAATGAFAVAMLFDYFPSWWVGTSVLTPIVFFGGFLILRKMKRFVMASTFLAVYLIITAATLYSGQDISVLKDTLWLALTATPLLFFVDVMLTEPLTSPYAPRNYIPYALLVGFLYSYNELHLAPEEALLIGNALAFLLAPDKRRRLSFTSKKKEAENIYSYLFKPSSPLQFKPGQFLEWTLAVNKSDARGNRRYLTIASSPTEKDVMITVKRPDKASSFKRTLDSFQRGDSLLASHLSGAFVLPKNKDRKLAFIAGGIGVTPFRSMTKYLLDAKETRDISLLYATSKPEEIAFRKLFDKALAVGLKTTYAVTDSREPLPSWDGLVGGVDAKLIKRAIPDYRERLFYISGPYGLVQASREALDQLGVEPSNIRLDYFPGYG